MSQTVVIDTDAYIALDGGDCTDSSVMTKKKICLGAFIISADNYGGHIIYWDDVAATWKLRWFGTSTNSEAPTPGGAVPNTLH